MQVRNTPMKMETEIWKLTFFIEGDTINFCALPQESKVNVGMGPSKGFPTHLDGAL